MKKAHKAARQGEAFFIRVDKLPDGLTAVAPIDGELIVAHSETGHHHTVSAESASMYQSPDPLVGYLVIDDLGHIDVVHHRGYDTHETVRLLGGPGAVWRRNLQREWTPEGWERVAD